MSRAQSTADLIGLSTTSVLSVTGLTTALTQIQAGQASTPGGPDWITLQLVGAIASLVGALVFVHRLLMKSESDKLTLVIQGHLREVAKVEGGVLSLLAAKDETIRTLADDRQRQEVEAAQLRQVVEEKDAFVLKLIQVGRQTGTPTETTVDLVGHLQERKTP